MKKGKKFLTLLLGLSAGLFTIVSTGCNFVGLGASESTMQSESSSEALSESSLEESSSFEEESSSEENTSDVNSSTAENSSEGNVSEEESSSKENNSSSEDSSTENSTNKEFSEGLEYVLLKDNTYAVIGIGTCKDKDVIIPKMYKGKSVTQIGDIYGGGFSDCTNLKSIIIPDSVKTIAPFAFSDCENLINIEIPNSVMEMGAGVFDGCSKLTNVVIPDSVTEMRTENMFNGCESLTHVDLPDSVTVIGSYAFYDCRNLKNIDIPKSVKTIGVQAFSYCESLTNVVVPDSVEWIGGDAFEGCEGLISITLPFIGNSKDGTDDAQFGSIFKSINMYEYEVPMSLKSVVITSGESIGYRAFLGCSWLTNITLPDSVTSIGDQAFLDCSNLTDIKIPNSVTTIGADAFAYCINLTSLELGESVETIGDAAFYSCVKLIEIYNKSALEITAGSEGNGGIGYYAKNIYTSTEGTSRLSTDKDGYVIYTDGAEKILVGYKGSETELVLPSDITEIGAGAFAYCDIITSVEIPESVTTIDMGAFAYCINLMSVELGESVETIGDSAFGGCIKLIEIYNKSALLITVGSEENGGIGYYAKNIYTPTEGVSKLTTDKDGYVIYTDGAEKILVGYKGSETELVLSNGITKIDSFTFVYNDITSIKISDSVTTIGDSAFYGCRKLESIVIGSSVMSIGNYAFQECYKLIVYYKGTAEDWSKISIDSVGNNFLTEATHYYYSESDPTDSGNYWHYNENGEIVVWGYKEA